MEIDVGFWNRDIRSIEADKVPVLLLGVGGNGGAKLGLEKFDRGAA
jgi:hypothetical protein